MIGALRGEIVVRPGGFGRKTSTGQSVSDRGASGSVLIDVQGVGYEVTITAGAAQLIPEGGGEVSLIIYTDVRENAIQLFGFASHQEREIFLLLRKVKGIGAKVALAIVSHRSIIEILGAIGHGDTKALTEVPGVGKKLAERMIVELREFVGELARDTEIPLRTKIQKSVSGNSSASSLEGDVVLALEKLGFPGEDAREIVARTVEQCRAINPAALSSTEELLRLSLTNL